MKSNTVVLLGALAVGLVFLSSGCTITTEGMQNYEVTLEDILPPSRVVASYRQLAKPTRLNDTELQEQIGTKEQYEIVGKWSKMKAVYSDYGIPERPPKARVAVIELGNKQDAYGAYSNLRPNTLEDKCYLKIGVSGTVMEDRLVFVQDRFLILVRDLNGTPEPERRAMLVNFGYATSARIPKDITDITLVGYLPYDNRVPASEKLDKEDPLGLGVLKTGGVTANFKIVDKLGPKIAERNCTVFLSELKDKGGAKGILKRVRDMLDKEGKTEDAGMGEEGFTCSFRGAAGMVARREAVVFGAYGTYTEKELKTLMSNIDRRIKPYVPPKAKEKEKDPAEEEAAKKKQQQQGK
jgi:hypothetical protein